MLKEIIIDGEIYVPKSEKEIVKDYVIVRTYSAGVHVGEIEKKDGEEITLKNARRLWYWSGAATLSQLAMEGTKKPNACKIPCAVDVIILTEAVEIIPCKKEALKTIEMVPIWKA